MDLGGTEYKGVELPCNKEHFVNSENTTIPKILLTQCK